MKSMIPYMSTWSRDGGKLTFFWLSEDGYRRYQQDQFMQRYARQRMRKARRRSRR